MRESTDANESSRSGLKEPTEPERASSPAPEGAGEERPTSLERDGPSISEEWGRTMKPEGPGRGIRTSEKPCRSPLERPPTALQGPLEGEERIVPALTAPKEAGEAGAGDGTTREGRVGEGERLVAPALPERDSLLADEHSWQHLERGYSSEGPPTPDGPVVKDPCTGGTPPEADSPAVPEYWTQAQVQHWEQPQPIMCYSIRPR